MSTMRGQGQAGDVVADANSNTFIVSDARRPCDIEFLRAMTNCFYIRIQCSDAARRERGFVSDDVGTGTAVAAAGAGRSRKIPSVDASDSECGLDISDRLVKARAETEAGKKLSEKDEADDGDATKLEPVSLNFARKMVPDFVLTNEKPSDVEDAMPKLLEALRARDIL